MDFISIGNYKNQKEIILAHIKQYGNISTLEGYEKYKIMRVGSVINLLRNEGYNIITILEKTKEQKRNMQDIF